MVLARLGGVYLLAIEGTYFAVNLLIGRGRQSVDFGDFQILGYLGADVERVGIVVCICMRQKTKVEPTLYH
jgi:hypothetical protein